MTLTNAFNTISFYDINIELRGSGSATAEIGLDQAESGGYGAINRCASPSPTDIRPAAIWEWYSYNHYATSTNIDVNGFDYSATSCAAACALLQTCDDQLYYNTAQNFIYQDASCNTAKAAGYYARCSGGSHVDCYTIGSGGSFDGITSCTTTTSTTTTTTTLATGNCYEISVNVGSTTVYWQSTDGVNRNQTLSDSDGIKYICSLITPYETFPAELNVSAPGSSCTNNCQNILICKPCTYP